MNQVPRPSTQPWSYSVGGDRNLRQMSRSTENAATQGGAMGVVVPANGGMLMRRIAQMGVRGGVGGRILLGEGTYFFRSGATISAPGIELVGLGERTIFRREAANSTPLLTLSGAGIKLVGITFVDVASTGPAVKLTGQYGEVHRCIFTDCYEAAELAGAWQQLSESLVKASRSATASIRLTAASDCSVQCNRVNGAPVGADEIYGDNTSARCSFVGNVTGNPGSVNYKGAGLGSVDAANTGIITVRP